ncbi:NAD(P)/FAD-dependent oxidoreductase [Streptomyces tailanensis]|uniref:NAD(P)/FAD-dependent oxidoreductase n=1 Tax=Streptomyces tailanensis TaxID=2569858 RepID=UPI00122E5196|nr:pyridine nucleotide-disulfide oxidoreductase [Streptomyces tailanensis]
MSERPSPGRPDGPLRSAVVLGGSLAGMLAARTLAGFVDKVTVVERDALPDGPGPRRNLPQARHAHMLWSGGVRALEDLVPGATERLLAAGAHRQAVTTDMVILSSQGWCRRWPVSHRNLLCSRDLLDATVRADVLDDDRVEPAERTEVLGLVGTGAAVTGVRVRHDDGTERVLDAGLVVDATGRSSRAPQWLAALGLPEPRRRVVDSGLAYATRVYRAPEGARRGYPVVSVQPDTRQKGPGRSAFLLPIEDGKWIVTLSGTRGGEPSPHNDDFVRFAREELRHPAVAELLTHAEPLGDVAFTRSTANRRHFYERMPRWPENFTVVGDALAVYNPVYGHGMAIAAQSAVVLREVIRRQGWGAPGLARRVQKALARPVGTAWDLATGQDVFYEGATESGPTLRDRAVAAYVNRVLLTATGNGRIARRLTDVTSLERGPEVLLSPGVVLAAALGPLKPPLEGVPLTAEERKAAGL